MRNDRDSNLRNNGIGVINMPRDAVFAAFDALPSPLRRKMREMNLDFDPHPILRGYREGVGLGYPEETVVSHILREMDRIESDVLDEYVDGEAEAGRTVPHVAAGATIVRYDAAIRRRRCFR